jgi:uncharacterized protein YbaR (Trm112 family)
MEKNLAPKEFDIKLLDVLACPITKEPLFYNQPTNELISAKAGLAFAIKDGIPVLLIDEARKV